MIGGNVAPPLVIITGATHGIGRALALAFAKDGHPLLLIARHAEPIPELSGHPLKLAAADVTDYARLQAAIAAGEAQFGPADCLINNAGFIHIGDFAKRSVEDRDYEIDVLIKGVVHGVRAVLPGMIERKRGTIVNVSSIGDRRPGPTGETYHAAKAAVRSLAESLQQAEAKNNIRVINIAPGLVKTNIHETMGISFEEYCKMLGNPDFIAPERIAEIVLFCYRLPQLICIRDLVVMPTTSAY
jgi:NADP-dependent 3-hydroxy acid dehydrogenase YdfG